MFDNKYLYQECGLVEEPDLEEATNIGMDMLEHAKTRKFLALAANQVGYNKQVVVVRDDDGYDVYFNPEISILPVKNGMFEVDQEAYDYAANIPSLPKKRVLVKVVNSIEVNAFSIINDDRINFTAEGQLAKVWQVMIAVLNGVDKQDVVPCDYQTVKNKEKKRPNARCERCGKKNKVCHCPKEEEETSFVELARAMDDKLANKVDFLLGSEVGPDLAKNFDDLS